MTGAIPMTSETPQALGARANLAELLRCLRRLRMPQTTAGGWWMEFWAPEDGGL